MNHLIVRSHLGTNFELIENFLKQDNDFFRFIYEDDPKLFIEQYQQDVADGLVINQIDIEETKNNWKSFFENIIENIENIYSADLRTQWFVYVSYTYAFKFKNKDKVKTLWFMRNPLMSWAHRENICSSKDLTYNAKMLNDEYIQTMIDWAETSLKGFDREKMTPWLKNLLSRVDVDNLITFFTLFICMCTNPSIFSIQGHKIPQESFKACTSTLFEYFNKHWFIFLIRDESTIFPKFSDFSYNRLEDIFNDDNIFDKFKSFSVILQPIYDLIETKHRQYFKYIIQNLMYVLIKLDSYFNYTSNTDGFLLSNLNKEFLQSLNIDSVMNVFELLDNINIDDILYATTDDGEKLEDPRNNPVKIENLKNKRPIYPESEEEYTTGYNLGYDNQIKDTSEQIIDIAYSDGFDKLEKNKLLANFGSGFHSGFQAGFNDCINSITRRRVWNKKVITYDDGYSLGYERGYEGGEAFKRMPTTDQQNLINIYYNGIRDGYYHSILDINQQIYSYHYDCGYYDKKMDDLNSGIGNNLTNSVSNFLKDIIINPIQDKLIFYEDIIHPYRVQSWNSLLRFFYFYYFSSYDYIQKPNLETLSPKDVINQSLALLDLKIYLGQQTLPTDITFKRHNSWINATEKLDSFAHPMKSWTGDWQSNIYQWPEWKEYLTKDSGHGFDQHKIMNTFRFFDKNLEFAYKQWLYEGNRTTKDYYENIE